MKKASNDENRFCVIQFKQPPYKGIDKYVCVPYSWIVIRRSLNDGTVLATYPSSEKPLDNKARVKRREKPSNSWFVYKATIKHECKSFKDAEHWIATRSDDNSTEDPKTKESEPESEPEPEPGLDRKLRSATRYSASNCSQDKSQLAAESYEDSRKLLKKTTSQLTREDNLLVQPGSSNASNVRASAMHENCGKEASMPLLDDYEPNEVTIMDDKTQPESTPPASEAQCLKELLQKPNVQEKSGREPEVCHKTNPHCMMAAPNIAPKPSTSGRHLFQANQHTTILSGKSFNNSKPREKRTIRREDTVVTHDDQRPRQREITKNTLFTPYNLPTLVKASSQIYNYSETQLSSVIKNSYDLIRSQNIVNTTNQSSSFPPNSVERLTNLVTQSHQQETAIPQEMYGRQLTKGNSNQGLRSTMDSYQNALQAEKHFERSDIVNPIDLRNSNQNMTENTSVAQNVSNLAHHHHCSTRRPEYLQTQENNLHQIPQVQYKDIHAITPEYQNLVQRMMFYNTMSPQFAEQNQTHPVDLRAQYPLSYFMPLNQNLQVPVVDQNHLRQEGLSEVQAINSDQTDHIQNSSNESNQMDLDYERSQSPNHQESRDLHLLKIRPGIPIKSKRDRPKSGLKGIIKKPALPPVLPIASNKMRESILTAQGNYPIQDLRAHGMTNTRSTEQKNMIWVALPQTNMAEPTPVVQNIQSTSSSDRSHEIQTKSVYENQVYQNPCSNMKINQSTNSLNTKHVHFLDEIVASSAAVESSMKIDKMCQTDECTSEESQSPDPEFVTDHEHAADHDMSPEETPAEIISNDRTTETIPPQRDFTVKPEQYTMTENYQAQSRIEVKQQLRQEISNLFHVMNTNLSNSFDKFNKLHKNINETAKLHQRMVEAFNMLKNSINIKTSNSSNVSETSQVADENQSGQRQNDANFEAFKANKLIIRGYRDTFVFPPDYNPRDSKWTLKYRKKTPGLVELMPQTDIYVGYLRFEYCKRVSKDCQTLVKMLLPEVFSLNALSICSLTGKKENASDAAINIRPGLDKWARTVLLKFVEEFGLQYGWDISDQPGILGSMQEKILEIRGKYGETKRVPVLYIPNRRSGTTA